MLATDLTATLLVVRAAADARRAAGPRQLDTESITTVRPLPSTRRFAFRRTPRDQRDGLLDEAGRRELTIREAVARLCERETPCKATVRAATVGDDDAGRIVARNFVHHGTDRSDLVDSGYDHRYRLHRIPQFRQGAGGVSESSEVRKSR